MSSSSNNQSSTGQSSSDQSSTAPTSPSLARRLLDTQSFKLTSDSVAGNPWGFSSAPARSAPTSGGTTGTQPDSTAGTSDTKTAEALLAAAKKRMEEAQQKRLSEATNRDPDETLPNTEW
jgi:hypothetical protein